MTNTQCDTIAWYSTANTQCENATQFYAGAAGWQTQTVCKIFHGHTKLTTLGDKSQTIIALTPIQHIMH